MRTSIAVAAAALIALCLPAAAQTPEQFYKGKSIDLVIGYPTGGANDVFARSLARHMGKHIPGHPGMVARNMPGGGSLLATNHIFQIAPKDGTVIGIVSPTIPLDQKLGNSAVRYDVKQLAWIGRIGPAVNPLMVWRTQPYTSWKDALTQEITLSATGVGSTVSVYPTVLNNVLKTRFKLVMGYKGSGESMLAMERGEVAGHCTALEAVTTQHPKWIPDGEVKVLLQFALTRHHDMPDVPTVLEIASTDEQRAILKAVMNATAIGKPVIGTPGMPPERLAVLRRAFDETVKDPEFIDEFHKQRVELDPLTGEELQKLVDEVADISPDLLAKVKANYGG